MARVGEDEVLLLWRALTRFRSGSRPACAPDRRTGASRCPLSSACPRWSQPDDEQLSIEETTEQTERRRAGWPCSRVLDLLGPDVTRIS